MLLKILLIITGMILGAFLYFTLSTYYVEIILEETRAFYWNDYICYQAVDIANQFEYKSYHELCHYSVNNNYEHFCYKD